ncbi:MAG: DUF1045 domain-containing protein [Deltaproteobacteria bacterium]|jgi:hypothetical protein|nr:DUF1045 domain-containing protein [Deltaproteobacteria bacterium]
MTERYCVFHVPDPQAFLYALGSSALGRCIRTGQALEPPWPEAAAKDFPPCPTRAAVYGFHATLVAPFESLVPPETLTETLRRTALGLEAVPLGPLELRLMPTGFPALAPRRPPDALGDLEGVLVKAFAGFRLPPGPEELARREPLTARQRDLARKWGYPFVFDEFRYHLTLGDRLQGPGDAPDPRTLNLLDLLSSLLTEELLEGCSVDALSLARQSRAGAPFHVLAVTGLRSPGIAAITDVREPDVSAEGVDRARIPEPFREDVRIPEPFREDARIPEPFRGDARIPEPFRGDAGIPDQGSGRESVPEPRYAHPPECGPEADK